MARATPDPDWSLSLRRTAEERRGAGGRVSDLRDVLGPVLAEAVAALVAEGVAAALADLPTEEPWPAYMDAPTAARYLGVTEERVRKLIARRTLPVIQRHRDAASCSPVPTWTRSWPPGAWRPSDEATPPNRGAARETRVCSCGPRRTDSPPSTARPAPLPAHRRVRPSDAAKARDAGRREGGPCDPSGCGHGRVVEQVGGYSAVPPGWSHGREGSPVPTRSGCAPRPFILCRHVNPTEGRDVLDAPPVR